VKFKGTLISEASGSVGGLTFSHNRGGQYIRARAVPVNGNTSYQQAVRGWFTTAVGAWTQTLTQANRDAWAAYADAVMIPDSLGEPRKLPPLAMFVRSMVSRAQAGQAIVPVGPAELELPTFSNPTFSFAVATQKVSVGFINTDAWAGEAGGFMLVYASKPTSKSINYFKGPYRYVGKITGATPTPPTSPQLFDPPSPFTAAQKMWAYVRVLRADGRLSGTFRGGAVPA